MHRPTLCSFFTRLGEDQLEQDIVNTSLGIIMDMNKGTRNNIEQTKVYRHYIHWHVVGNESLFYLGFVLCQLFMIIEGN